MDESYGPATYGERVADVYDAWYGDRHPFLGPNTDTVSFLSKLAGPGPALELGIGTGRIALPLAEEGVGVCGIEASEAMVAKLRAKPGGEHIDVTLGDFRDFELDGRFRLVYVVFNTFFALLTQDDQVACFRAVARHLTDEGAFVMEAFVPDHGRFDRGQRVSALRVDAEEVSLEVTKHDPKEQTSDTQLVVIRDDAIRLFPIRIRFATVPELDLMARLAGLRLRERWGDWDRTAFTATSGKHISVWDRAASMA